MQQILEQARNVKCACAKDSDGNVTSRSLCRQHADTDPCLTRSRVTGKRRKGSIVRRKHYAVCSHCGWHNGTLPEEERTYYATPEEWLGSEDFYVDQLIGEVLGYVEGKGYYVKDLSKGTLELLIDNAERVYCEYCREDLEGEGEDGICFKCIDEQDWYDTLESMKGKDI